MKLLQFFIQKASILCSLPVPQAGNQIPDGLQLPKKCLGNGKRLAIHAGERRMKIIYVLAHRALRCFPLMVKKMLLFIWVTDGHLRILPTAGTSGFRLSGKKECQ